MRFTVSVASAALLAVLLSSVSQAAPAQKCVAFSESRREDPARKARAEALKAIAPYKNYFDAISARLYERQYIIELAELALLSKEHLLLMGPPGTAKSMIADTILGNILERATGLNSYFRIQMTPETTISETHGPLDFKTLQETGAYVRKVDESAFAKRTNFLDEVLDARANGIRNILGLLNERVHSQGVHVTQGVLETAIAATNHYLSQVYEKSGDDRPKAVVDRFAFVAFIPDKFEHTSSYISLIQAAGLGRQPIPKFYFEELDSLRELVKQVSTPPAVAKFLAIVSTKTGAEIEATEQSSLANYKKRIKDGEEPGIPYRATKYFNPRTSASKAGSILKAIVVRDWIHKNGKRRLEVTLDDVRELRKFFSLNGPNEAFVNQLLERSSHADERTQLQTILLESQVFNRQYDELLNEANSVLVHYSLHDLQLEVEMAPESDRQELSKKIIGFILALDEEANASTPHADRSGKDIGVELVREQYVDLLAQALGGRAEADKIMMNLDNERRALIARREAEEERLRQEAERARVAEERRLAAERAQVEAREAKLKAERDAFVASYGSKTLVWKNKMPIADVGHVRSGYNKQLGLVAFLDASNGIMKMIDVNSNTENPSSQDYVLDLNEAFSDGQFNEVHIIDKNTIVLISDEGRVANIVDLPTKGTSEVPLYIGDEVPLVAFEPHSRSFSIVTSRRSYLTGNFGSVIRQKGKLKFKTAELESEWDDAMADHMHPPQLSPDRKYLTVLAQHGTKAFVIEQDGMQVVSSHDVLPSATHLEVPPNGDTGRSYYASQKFLVADTERSPVVYRAIEDKGGYRSTYFSNYGLTLIPGTEMAISGSNSAAPLLHSLSDDTGQFTKSGAESRYSHSPVLLDDGRIVTLLNDINWHVGLLK